MQSSLHLVALISAKISDRVAHLLSRKIMRSSKHLVVLISARISDRVAHLLSRKIMRLSKTSCHSHIFHRPQFIVDLVTTISSDQILL